MYQGVGGMLPDSCPGVNVCGTSAPVWLQTEIPPLGTQAEAEACVSWPFGGEEYDCCLFTISVRVRNCGHFVSYYLQPTQACSIAYCVQTNVSVSGSSLEPTGAISSGVTPQDQVILVDDPLEDTHLVDAPLEDIANSQDANHVNNPSEDAKDSLQTTQTDYVDTVTTVDPGDANPDPSDRLPDQEHSNDVVKIGDKDEHAKYHDSNGESSYVMKPVIQDFVIEADDIQQKILVDQNVDTSQSEMKTKNVTGNWKPEVEMKIEGGRILFQCKTDNLESEESVVWSRIEQETGEKMDLSVQTLNNGESTFSPGVLLRPGDKMLCSVEGVESAPCPTGLQLSHSSMNLREDGVGVILSIVQHSPVICTIQPCHPTLVIQTRNSYGGTRPADVLVSRCSVPLLSAVQCQSTSCSTWNITVQAAADIIQDGDTVSFLDFAVVSDGHTNFDDYFLPSVQVNIKDMSSGSCHVYTDPHFITFDGLRYDVYLPGTFVLIKSLKDQFEAHVRFWECNREKGKPISCVCGLAVRDGNDFISLDMCPVLTSTEAGDFLPELVMLPLDGQSVKTRVLESRHGKTLTFYLESGRNIRVHMEYWGLSLSIQTTGTDHGLTRGLCGIFDGDERNEFHDRSGAILQHRVMFGQINSFAEAWRLKRGENMFDVVPSSVQIPGRGGQDPGQADMCSCQHHTTIVTKDSDSISRLSACEKFRVPHDQLLTYVDISPAMTQPGSRYSPVQSGQVSSSYAAVNSDDHSVYMNDQPHQLTGNLRKIVPEGANTFYTTRSVSKRSAVTSTSGEDRIAYIFPGDDFDPSLSEEPVRPSYPTKSGLTEDQIYELCNQMLLNSTLYKSCSKYIKNVYNILDICILDVSLMDDSMWASFSLSLLETECEQAILASQLSWHTDIMGRPQVPPHIVEAINCPNLCSGNGFCNGRHCVCSPGYTSHDCSHLKSARSQAVLPPYLYMAANNSVCDHHTTKCHKISILGQDFLESTDLKCGVSEIKVSGEERFSSEEERQVPATFITSSEVLCLLDRKDVNIAEGTRNLKIRVTNDRAKFSNEVFLTIVDTTCHTCPDARMPQNPTTCKSIPDTCQTRQGCKVTGDSHPRKPCMMCRDGRWISTAPDIFKEKEVAVQLISGEKFLHNLEVPGPGLSLKLGQHPAGVLLEGHLITWNTEDYQAADSQLVIEVFGESVGCKKKDRLQIHVEIVSCDCENGGDCIRGPNHSPACICPPEFTGSRCEAVLSDPCIPNPCLYGTCQHQAGTFKCVCEPGFKGALCQTETDPCSSNPCFSGVICSASVDGSYSCGSCPGNLIGDGQSCAPPGLCNPNPCYPGVKCTALNWYFQCGECPAGLTGDGISCYDNNLILDSDQVRDEEQFDDDAENDDVDDTLLDLSDALPDTSNPCEPNPCYPNVTCYTGPGDLALCGDCPEGMQGDGTWCSRDYCSPSPCHPGVECITTLSGFQCAPCPQGYTGNGISCRDLCSGMSCYPGVDCILVDGMPVCGPCPAHMIGDGRTCVVDACSSNPCFQNVDCIHTNQSYECGPCPRGLVGDGVECYKDPCTSSPCHPGVTCTHQSKHKYTCGPCPTGFIGNGETCEAVTEYTQCGKQLCFPGVLCIQDGDVDERCGDCPAGYLGDGVTCTLDHCQHNNPCFRGVSCYNFPEKAKCGNCPKGYIGNGVKCTAVVEDPCSLQPCYPGVTCVNLWMGHSKGFLCGSCPESMVGDGINCWESSVCAPSPCFPGVACTPGQDGKFECGSCPDHLAGDGINCYAPGGGLDHCISSPCYPGVSCRSTHTGYLCGACPPGMQGNGSQCQDIDDCSPNPCYPGVACRDEPAPGRGYTCGRCPKPLLGDGTICTSPRILKCPPGLRCFPGVDCVEAPGDQITCGSCPPGMVGNGLFCKVKCTPPCNGHQKCSKQHCSRAVNSDNNPDNNNNTLNEIELIERRQEFEVTKYTSLGKRGPMYSVYRASDDASMVNESQVEYDRDDGGKKVAKCRRKCRNGGVCVGKNKCSCPPQWRGKSCRKPRCKKGCRNGGKCIAPDKCLCTQFYTGKSCKRAKCGLNGVKCENGGKCRKSGRCRCLPGYHGRYCSKHVNSVQGNKIINTVFSIKHARTTSP